MSTPVPLEVKASEGKALASLFGDRNQADFVKRYGVPGGSSMLSQHISGNRPINLEAALVYASGLGVEVRAFSPRLQAELDRIRQAAQEIARTAGAAAGQWDENVTDAPAVMRPRKYPVISSVQAGDWTEIVETFQPGDAEEYLDSPVDLGPHGFILRVEGPSMTNPNGGKDNFPEGMYVHVRPDVDTQPGDYVVAKRVKENKATFKKLVMADGELYLHAINPDWPTPYIKLEPGDRIIGKLKSAAWKY